MRSVLARLFTVLGAIRSAVNPDNFMINKVSKAAPTQLNFYSTPGTGGMVQGGIRPEEFSLEMWHWHAINAKLRCGGGLFVCLFVLAP